MGDPRDETKNHGPSWWDCARLVEDIQTRHDCSVMIMTVPHTEKGRGVTAWHVRAAAHPPKQMHLPAIQAASHQFRGNGGASTYTAALWWALSRLNEQMTTKGGQQALPGF